MLKKLYEKQILKLIFSRQEEYQGHHTYDEEKQLFEMLRDGNPACIEKLEEMRDGFGSVSKDPLRNQQYLFVATVTLAVRFAIEGGVDPKEAYQLSDAYILMMDTCTSVQEVWQLQKKMLGHYVRQVAESKKIHVSSHTVHLCLNYIEEHLHEPISLRQLSAYAGRSPSYLSGVFKRQIGMGVAKYVRKKRIEMAKRLLLYSEYSALEISNYLCFSSHSHFIQIFKKETGLTPLQYKEKFFCSSHAD